MGLMMILLYLLAGIYAIDIATCLWMVIRKKDQTL